MFFIKRSASQSDSVGVLVLQECLNLVMTQVGIALGNVQWRKTLDARVLEEEAVLVLAQEAAAVLEVSYKRCSLTDSGFTFLISGSKTGRNCSYKCQSNGGCEVTYIGPSRPGQTSGSCFPQSFGGSCSGTPPECQDCKRALNCWINVFMYHENKPFLDLIVALQLSSLSPQPPESPIPPRPNNPNPV